MPLLPQPGLLSFKTYPLWFFPAHSLLMHGGDTRFLLWAYPFRHPGAGITRVFFSVITLVMLFLARYLKFSLVRFVC